ncbi:hypothetical protein OV450_3396 [Actinobacteria bacterium OV450]|nr:hypothetical protein OV450_3396 [Actinobacteria bacterium OV450]
MTPEELLLAAADDIAAYGHHKGRMYGLTDDPDAMAPACALGAIIRRSKGYKGFLGDLMNGGAIQLLHDHISDGLGTQDDAIDDIAAWNDHPQITKEDVILAMKTAAHSPSDRPPQPRMIGSTL